MRTIKQLLITVAVLLCSITANAYDFEVDGIYYNISGDEAIVTYKGSSPSAYSYEYSGSVVIPEEVTYNGKTYSVTSIGESAFRGCDGLASVTIGNSVTSIGESAFENCSGLTSVTIPNSVTSIDSEAFQFCSGLTSVTIPNSVTSIGMDAFYGCDGLASVTIPNSVTSIGESAFKNCSGLTSVTIGNSVTSIGYRAFENCSSLASVTIPNSVTSISFAFGSCENLKEVHISDLAAWCNIDFEGVDSNPLYYADNLYLNGELIKDLIIPESVENIKNYAFYNCRALTSVTIPNSVTSIGGRAFYNCSGLTSVTIPNSVTSIGYLAFQGCDGLASIIVESGNEVYDSRENCNAIIETATNTLVAGCKNSVIPNSVTSIGKSAFDYCSGLTSVTIPNSVTSIGEGAFYNCI